MDNLVELLERSAEDFAESPALLIKPSLRYRVWTYSDLWEDTGRVANYLQDRGVKKGDRVLIWGPNMPQWVLAFFGALRAGASVVPLDVRSAPDFVEQVVDRTEPRFAFTSRLTDGSSNHETPSVRLEELDQAVAEHTPRPAEVPIEPDDLAEIMFTSGTTGDPKGVMLTHRSVSSNVRSVADAFPGDASDRLLSILPLSHMFEQCGGLLVPLLNGARIVYPTSRQPTFIFRALQENGITLLLLVPQGLQLFIEGIEREVERRDRTRAWTMMNRWAPRLPMTLRRRLFNQVHARLGGRVRVMLSGGAYLDPALAQKWENLGIAVAQGYGATEASPVITFNRLRERVQGSVGRALLGQEVRIAEDGEVLTRGRNVTPGYWQDEEATAAAFEGGWYRTGDLGYLDGSGNLFLKGRKKDLIVPASGQNVYADDVERALNAHPAVAEAVVAGLPDERSGAETVHAILLLEDPSVPAKDIIEEANAKLADHQRITGHTVWPEDDFPRTHTLKVRKGPVVDYVKAALEGGSKTSDTQTAAPFEKIDALARIVAEVAQVSPQTVREDQTLGGDLGMDSLKRVELLSAVEQDLGAYVDESLLSPATTVAALRELVAEQARGPRGGIEFRRWPFTAWCNVLREGLQHALVFPAIRTGYRPMTAGLENLADLDGPVLFAVNHNAAQWDSLVLLSCLPGRWRRRMSYAAAAEITFGTRWIAVLASLLAAAFPFSRDTAVRQSLEYLGGLLDKGWNVGIFPEGEQRVGQEMLPFMTGVGLLAVESRTPVVPVHLVNHGTPRHGLFRLPWRQAVSVRIGKPLTFGPSTSYVEATERIEEAVRSL